MGLKPQYVHSRFPVTWIIVCGLPAMPTHLNGPPLLRVRMLRQCPQQRPRALGNHPRLASQPLNKLQREERNSSSKRPAFDGRWRGLAQPGGVGVPQNHSLQPWGSGSVWSTSLTLGYGSRSVRCEQLGVGPKAADGYPPRGSCTPPGQGAVHTGKPRGSLLGGAITIKCAGSSSPSARVSSLLIPSSLCSWGQGLVSGLARPGRGQAPGRTRL